MLKVNLIAGGGIKEKYFVEAINEYKKRLTRFCSLKIIEVEEESAQKSVEKKIELESGHLESHLKGNIILFDISGMEVSSENLAEMIKGFKDSGKGEITFVIGGSNGVSDKLKAQTDKRISFGKITYPHQLFRVVALEQIYRAFTILEGLPYHK